jgi:hypothetical protein
MGVDLHQYGNHTINFKNRDFEEIAQEIKNKLDHLKLVNEEYLKALVIIWEQSYLEDPNDKQVLRDKIQKRIKKIKERKNWEWNYFIRDDDGYKTIEFIGFLDFELDFSTDKIYFWEPPYRFFGWFRMDKIIRDEWRKYMYQIVHLFGGSRAIYLPDNTMEAEKYLDIHDSIDSPFEEIENDLINEFGKNNFTIDEYDDEEGVAYFIDDFEGLVLENTMSVDEFVNYINNLED